MDALEGFFEPPPPPPAPEPRRYRTPPWFGAPKGTLPGVVPIELVIARTDAVAVCVTRVGAYPVGWECDLVTLSSTDNPELDPMLFHHHRPPGRELAPEMLRFGVEFADGSKATNTGGFPRGAGRVREPPDGPVMTGRGGGGGGGQWQQTYWFWPLPPPGPLAFVCEWPSVGIPLTRAEIDARAIVDAVGRAQVIFSDEHLPEPPDEEDCGPPPTAHAG